MDDRLKAREEELIAIVARTGADLEKVKSRLESDMTRVLGIPMTMRQQP